MGLEPVKRLPRLFAKDGEGRVVNGLAKKTPSLVGVTVRWFGVEGDCEDWRNSSDSCWDIRLVFMRGFPGGLDWCSFLGQSLSF